MITARTRPDLEKVLLIITGYRQSSYMIYFTYIVLYLTFLLSLLVKHIIIVTLIQYAVYTRQCGQTPQQQHVNSIITRTSGMLSVSITQNIRIVLYDNALFEYFRLVA